MKIISSAKYLLFILTLSIVAFSVVVLPAFAESDHDESVSHEESGATSHEEHEKIEKMEELIEILQQLIVLLTQQAGLEVADVQEDDHSDDDHDHGSHDHESDSGDLAVWIEIHSFMTHAHVQVPGSDLDTFFIHDHEYTEEEAIIEEIALRTGLSVHDIEEVIVFPSGELTDDGDSIEDGDDHEDEIDLDGIHIMADGTIMLGSGAELDDAIITDDGMIMLSDGNLVEPEFDLR